MRNVFKNWAPFAVVLTIALGAVYVVSQQVLRQSANDPQIQLVEDWSEQIASGTAPTGLSLGPFIDPNHSLAPFGIVYNANGSIASSSAAAPSSMAQPDGVLAAADKALNNELRFTWQPSTGTRFAAIIKRATFGDNVYYVLSARNLREVEKREDTLMVLAIGLWFIGLIATLASLYLHKVPHAVRRLRGNRA